MLLPETDLEHALIAAERFRVAVDGTTVEGARGGRRSLTISIGVGCFPVHASSMAELMELTDAALYAAKRTGRNRVCVASLSKEQEAPPAPASPSAGASTVLERLRLLVSDDMDSPLASTRMAARMLNDASTPGDALHTLTTQLRQSSEQVRVELLQVMDELSRALRDMGRPGSGEHK